MKVILSLALVLSALPAFAQSAPPGGAVSTPPLLLRDEGVDKGRLARAIDFVGGSVTCTWSAGVGTCTVSGGGSVTITEVEVDFGATPLYVASATITDAGVSSTSKILFVMSGNAATSRDADENEMDKFECSVTPGTGSFVLHCFAIPGPVTGKFKFFYTVG